jgi:sarcosine oxidase/L-pipecolate oxidase
MKNGQPATACVVGAGIIGSWTALQLVEAGVGTTLFEQFPLPHDRGSSHGASRAFRFLGDDPQDRLVYSIDRWHALAAETESTLFLETGLLNFGPPEDEYLQHHMAVLQRAGRPCEWLDSNTVRDRFPTLRYPDEWGAAWDPGGGILFADRCLQAVQSRFRALGGSIETALVESVESLAGDGARIHLASGPKSSPGTRTFDRAVICAGPWTTRLLPQLATHLRSLLIPVTYWRDPAGSHGVSNRFPILFNARLTGVYALPACEDHGHVKILFHGGPEADPDFPDAAAVEPYIEKVSRYVREHLPLLDHKQPVIREYCRYTMTPDNEPIIDRLDDNLVVGCGFSGSGFKHSPATGQMLAALAMGKENSLPEGFRFRSYALERFPV